MGESLLLAPSWIRGWGTTRWGRSGPGKRDSLRGGVGQGGWGVGGPFLRLIIAAFASEAPAAGGAVGQQRIDARHGGELGVGKGHGIAGGDGVDAEDAQPGIEPEKPVILEAQKTSGTHGPRGAEEAVVVAAELAVGRAKPDGAGGVFAGGREAGLGGGPLVAGIQARTISRKSFGKTAALPLNLSYRGSQKPPP